MTPLVTLHPTAAAAAVSPSIHLDLALPEPHHAPSEVLGPPPQKSESQLCMAPSLSFKGTSISKEECLPQISEPQGAPLLCF